MLARSPARAVGPRIEALAAQLDSPATAKAAVAALAMLASCSETARRAMLVNKVEARIVALLSKSTIEPQMQTWGLSVLSNLAVGRGGLAGAQDARVPMLSALIASHDPEVQHAAALHLATLSHSPEVRRAIARAPSAPLTSLYTLEDPATAKEPEPPSPYARRLRDEALDYARLALRTSQGRNYKPAFDRRAFYAYKAQEKTSATRIQAEARRWRAQGEYNRLRRRRRSGAVIVQKNVRRLQAKASVQQLETELHTAASRIGARGRGYVVRKDIQSKLPSAKGTAEATEASATDELPNVLIVGLRLNNAEGKFMMISLKIWAAPDDPLQPKPAHSPTLGLNAGVEPETSAEDAEAAQTGAKRAVGDGGAAQPAAPESDREVASAVIEELEYEQIAALALSVANSAIAAAIVAATLGGVDSPRAQVAAAPIEKMDSVLELDAVSRAAEECAREAVGVGIKKALLTDGAVSALVAGAPDKVMDPAVEVKNLVSRAAEECAREAVRAAIEKALLPEGAVGADTVMDSAGELDTVGLAAEECAREAVRVGMEKALLPEGVVVGIEPVPEGVVADQEPWLLN
jgi:DNA-directed RNA polymerase subunit K/omega